jgi:hypothetical protein
MDNIDFIGDLKEFREFADMTSGVKTILCLGLGSPSSSSVARSQLALLMHMREYLGLVWDLFVFNYLPLAEPPCTGHV